VVIAGHPLAVAGYALRGWGWAGVVVSALFGAVVVYGLSALRLAARREAAAVSVLAAALLAVGPALDVPVPAQVRGVATVQTAWGRLHSAEDALPRMAAMGQTQSSADSAVTAIVWPESIIGRYEPALFPVLDLEVLRPAARRGVATVVGMDLPLGRGRQQTVAVGFYPDGRTVTAAARQPVPVALWKPWTDDSFIVDWTASNVLPMGQGDRAAVFFCYEEFLPGLFLLNELLDDPTMYLAMSNTWADRNGGADTLQRLHSQGMALLFGRAYLRSTNRPTDASPGPDRLPQLR
jgi:hypothetical protein